MSALMSGRNTNTPEHIERLRQMKIGVPRSEETKVKISKAKKGRPSAFKGRRHSAEARALMSQRHKGQLAGSAHPSYRDDISTDEILRMLNEGLTKVQIAAHFKVSTTFIHRRLDQARHAGVEVPYKKQRAFPSIVQET